MTGAVPLPRGTPTLLLTDIEESTRLLAELGEGYPAVLARCRQLQTEAFEGHGGVVFGSEGDALFAAFEVAAGAVAGAIAAQQALADEPWPDGRRVRVRVGMHSGEVTVVDNDYVGMTVHVAARVAAAAHGGQILLTEVTAALAGDLDTVDLGRHRLKDVGEHHLLQVRSPGLEADFPPLRSLSSLPNNLPAAVDVFVGRHTERVELVHAVTTSRLVTLTGPGGSGKTRLALEVASGLLPRFADGVWLVDLDAIDDTDRVVPAVAEALHVRERQGEPHADTLEGWLRDRTLLLVLDNCEHVISGVRSYCRRYLAACPPLRILATSREVLGVRGETAFSTPPLRVAGGDPAEARASDAVELFVTRAAATAPTFDLGRADLATIVRICQRLDGLPLAIELAAARLRALSLDQLDTRLDDRFRLLTAGPADTGRHQTLEAVVAWSYDLLDEAERRLFERLAVFPHHFSLEMVEAVASGDPIDELDVVDLLGHLVDKSLVVPVEGPGGLRYQLLVTLRHYALDRLAERGEVEQWQERLFAWTMATVDDLDATIRTPAMDDAIRRASADVVTHRSVSQWAYERGRCDAVLRIASLVPLTPNRGERCQEILAALDAAARSGELDPAAAGHGWAAIANCAFEQGDWATSVDAGERSAAAFEEAGRSRLAAWSKYLHIHAAWGDGDVETVDRLVAQAVEHFRAEGDEMGLGYTLWIAALRSRDLEAGAAAAAEADTLLRRAEVPMGIAHNIEGRGIIALERGRIPEAATYVAEAVQLFADYGNPGCSAHALEAAAVVLSSAGRPTDVVVEVLTAAESLRRISGQAHRPWEIRARGGPTAERVQQLDAAARAHGRSEPDLTAVAALAVENLQTVAATDGEHRPAPARPGQPVPGSA